MDLTADDRRVLRPARAVPGQVPRRLVAAGVLVATTGPKGGYRLAAPAEKITALDVFEAIEGTAPAFTCQDIRRHGLGAATPEECRRRCIIHTLVDSADAAWRSELAKKTIADLVSVLPSTLKHRTSTILSDAASGANRETGKPRR